MDNLTPYSTDDFIEEVNNITYFFVSKGKKNIPKIVEFSLLSILNDRKIFNLGFGDYDLLKDTIIDNVNSNNGDMRKVFSTVLSTIPKFFELNNNAAILVQGSDSTPLFESQCRLTCNKKCGVICKNLNKRIRAYRHYVNKNFVELSKSYIFFGRMENEIDFVQYVPYTEYRTLLVLKKNKLNLRN